MTHLGVFSIEPVVTEPVHTAYRRIITPIPAPDSVPLLKTWRARSPRSLEGMPPVLWHRAEGFTVLDGFGNQWLDFSSGILVANAGHGREEIRRAVSRVLDQGLLFSYFPNEYEVRLADTLSRLAPPGLDKVLLLITGAEAVENIVKIARKYGKTCPEERTGVLSFTGSFHGRTLGAQMIGGLPELKAWMGRQDPSVIEVPFPNCSRCPCGRTRYDACESECFSRIEETLDDKGFPPERVALVITETYLGGEAAFAPKGYMQRLREWCTRNGVLLAFDEVQASFGRTGRWFGFEHYDVVPDLAALGKGITSSLPLSCVLGSETLMDLFPPGQLSSTQAGNPVCAAAALENIRLLEHEGLVERADRMGRVLGRELEGLKAQFPDRIASVQGKGLVWAVAFQQGPSGTPDPALAMDVVAGAIRKGLMLTSPIGPARANIKIMPPLPIPEDAILDGVRALSEAVQKASGYRPRP